MILCCNLALGSPRICKFDLVTVFIVIDGFENFEVAGWCQSPVGVI